VPHVVYIQHENTAKPEGETRAGIESLSLLKLEYSKFHGCSI